MHRWMPCCQGEGRKESRTNLREVKNEFMAQWDGIRYSPVLGGVTSKLI